MHIYVLSACHIYSNIFIACVIYTPIYLMRVIYIYTNTQVNHITEIYIYTQQYTWPGWVSELIISIQLPNGRAGTFRTNILLYIYPNQYIIFITQVKYNFFITTNMLFSAIIPMYSTYFSSQFDNVLNSYHIRVAHIFFWKMTNKLHLFFIPS